MFSVSDIFPQVSLNFAGGASMTLKPQDYLIQQSSIVSIQASISISSISRGLVWITWFPKTSISSWNQLHMTMVEESLSINLILSFPFTSLPLKSWFWFYCAFLKDDFHDNFLFGYDITQVIIQHQLAPSALPSYFIKYYYSYALLPFFWVHYFYSNSHYMPFSNWNLLIENVLGHVSEIFRGKFLDIAADSSDYVHFIHYIHLTDAFSLTSLYCKLSH